MSNVRDVDTADFGQAVLQRSHELPVVVDFWAAWCGPCKVLGPILERTADEYDGAFELVKVDVDRNQQLAGQFGIQGIPTVIGFKDGIPAARFTGALPEHAVKQWIDDILPTEADAKVDAARDAALASDLGAAERLFREVLTDDPDHQDAGTGLASLLIADGRNDEALTVLGKLALTADVEKLQATARLAAGRSDDIAQLERKLEQTPGDSGLRIELAKALAAQQEFEPALDHLLGVVAEKGSRREEARLGMLDIFEVLGDEHPLTQAYRRQLANALF